MQRNEVQEYPKALYLAGQQLVVENAAQEDDAREDGYDDWPADAARGEAAGAPEAAEPAHQVDIDVLRETETRLRDLELQLQERDEQLTARENELASREEAVAAAEAGLAKKHAAALGDTPAPTGTDSTDGQPLDREALKARAAELGIEFARNITTEKLAELVAAAEAGTSE